MKKNYQKPTFIVVRLNTRHHLLTGSDTMRFGGNAEGGIGGDSRRSNSFWDDDDDY